MPEIQRALFAESSKSTTNQHLSMSVSQIRQKLRMLWHPSSRRAKRHTEGAVADELHHREYVGGMWEPLGLLQFQFMVSRGLRPDHVFLDIGCGSLRGGAKFIPYLEAGNYLGLDANQELIDAGLQNEIPTLDLELKRPELVVSQCFEFSLFSRQPDFALAQAVLIHLPEDEIRRCFRNLKAWSRPNTKLYVTYVPARRPGKIELPSHPYIIFQHSKEQMIDFGLQTGWIPHYIGDWGHPRGQVIVEYTST